MDDLISITRDNVLLFQKIKNFSSSSVCWSVINEDNMIITIILHYNRSYVSNMAAMLNVIETWNDDTKGNLCLKTAEWIFIFIVFLLLLRYLCRYVHLLLIVHLDPSLCCLSLRIWYSRCRAYSLSPWPHGPLSFQWTTQRLRICWF